MEREYSSVRSGFEVNEIRTHFFFGNFYRELGLENEIEVYAANHARIPQLKLIIANFLHVDISFAVVNNSEINRVLFLEGSVVSQLEPLDNCSLLEL